MYILLWKPPKWPLCGPLPHQIRACLGWPIEYGSGDGVWLLRGGIKPLWLPSWSLGLFALHKASCFYEYTQATVERFTGRGTNLFIIGLRHIGSGTSSPRQTFRWLQTPVDICCNLIRDPERLPNSWPVVITIAVLSKLSLEWFLTWRNNKWRYYYYPPFFNWRHESCKTG